MLSAWCHTADRAKNWAVSYFATDWCERDKHIFPNKTGDGHGAILFPLWCSSSRRMLTSKTPFHFSLRPSGSQLPSQAVSSRSNNFILMLRTGSNWSWILLVTWQCLTRQPKTQEGKVTSTTSVYEIYIYTCKINNNNNKKTSFMLFWIQDRRIITGLSWLLTFNLIHFRWLFYVLMTGAKHF